MRGGCGRLIPFDQAAETLQGLLPHPAAAGAFCRVVEAAVFEGEDASGRTGEKLHVDYGFCGVDGRCGLPDISDLIGADDPAGGVDARLKGFAAIEIDAEGIFCYLPEGEVKVVGIWGLKPGLDVFGDAEGVEDAAAVGLELEGQGDVPVVRAGDSGDRSPVERSWIELGIDVDVVFGTGQFVHFNSPRRRGRRHFRFPTGWVTTETE